MNASAGTSRDLFAAGCIGSSEAATDAAVKTGGDVDQASCWADGADGRGDRDGAKPGSGTGGLTDRRGISAGDGDGSGCSDGGDSSAERAGDAASAGRLAALGRRCAAGGGGAQGGATRAGSPSRSRGGWTVAARIDARGEWAACRGAKVAADGAEDTGERRWKSGGAAGKA
jgi:hypothetical protein